MGEMCGVDHPTSAQVNWPASEHAAVQGDVPMLIKALGVHSHGVAEQARKTLTHLAGRDMGSEPEPWLTWWQASQPSPPNQPEVTAEEKKS
jgi:hypothetical protein